MFGNTFNNAVSEAVTILILSKNNISMWEEYPMKIS